MLNEADFNTHVDEEVMGRCWYGVKERGADSSRFCIKNGHGFFFNTLQEAGTGRCIRPVWATVCTRCNLKDMGD